MATVAIASTLPTELTSRGIVFCPTFATTTGIEGGGGAADGFALQPRANTHEIRTMRRNVPRRKILMFIITELLYVPLSDPTFYHFLGILVAEIPCTGNSGPRR